MPGGRCGPTPGSGPDCGKSGDQRTVDGEETASTLDGPALPEYVDGLRFGPRGEPYLLGLGLVLRCRQNGDHARSRPVFLAPGWAMQGQERVDGLIPDREWLLY